LQGKEFTMRRPVIFGLVSTLSLAASVTIYGPLCAADLSGARDNFVAQCAKCHGDSGHGDGPAGATLAIRPRNFNDCTRMAKEPDERLFNTIKGGGHSVGLSKDMPSFGEAFEDQEIQGLITYIRQFCNAQRANK
jgi:mono/diheme cytochrome c family protein